MGDIREAVKKAYGDAIQNKQSDGCCCGSSDSSCCDSGAFDASDITKDNYSREETTGMPEEIVGQSFGCGNPVHAASLKPGERLLDLGSGAGLDLILSARIIGSSGHVYGLDMTKEMRDQARINIDRVGLRNVTLLQGYMEDIPLHDGSVDAVISNCVINLSPDKDKVLAEIYRVLSNSGRFCISDVVLLKPATEKIMKSLIAWSGCLAGALSPEEYREKLERAGFKDVKIEITKVHNIKPAESSTPEDIEAMKDLSASALVTASK